MSDYFYAAQAGTPGAASLFEIQNVEDGYLFEEGVSTDELGVGDEPYFELDGSFKGPLQDVVQSQGATLVVNDKVREIIEEFEPDYISFITVDIRDSKGKSVATYHVAHPTDLPDALDDEASGARVDETFGTVKRVRQLVVDEDKLDGRVLTRMARYGKPILIHRSLVDRLEEAETTGIQFKPLSEYSRFDRL